MAGAWPIAEVDRLASRQHGLVLLCQLLALGISPDTVQRWLTTGRLEAVAAGVYRLAGSPRTWEQRMLGAVLAAGPGAAASHRSAAHLWRLVDDADPTVEVTVGRARLPRVPGAVVHRSRDLDPAQLSHRRGIPVTAPPRTLVDLGAVLPRAEVEHALDRALVARLVTVRAVEAAVDAVARPGRRGAGVLGRILDERALGADRPDGLLEPRMARLLRAQGLPPAAFQHRVLHGRRFVARVDFAYPGRRIAVEVDGWEAHATPGALQGDLDRQNALVALGWTVLRFTWADVVRRPGKVGTALRAALGTENRA